MREEVESEEINVRKRENDRKTAKRSDIASRSGAQRIERMKKERVRRVEGEN